MIQPRGPRLLVRRLDETRMKSQYIEVIQHEDSPSQFAVVLAVGQLRNGGVEVGDTIVTKPYCGAPVAVLFEGNHIEAHLIMEDDALAVVGEEN